jgi:hypothetical protein
MMQVMADEGLVAPLSQYVQVYLNGQFYGLYGMIEEVRWWSALGTIVLQHVFACAKTVTCMPCTVKCVLVSCGSIGLGPTVCAHAVAVAGTVTAWCGYALLGQLSCVAVLTVSELPVVVPS